MNREESLQALQDAVHLSPENVPLRQHLADTLLGHDRAAEAEKEYRHALSLAPDNVKLKVGLAHAFFQQGKHSQALVVVEDLLKRPDTPARAYLLHSRLLLQSGDSDRAARQYREAVEADPSVADEALAGQLGLLPRKRVRQPVADEPLDNLPEEVERPTVTFADVGGMDALKEEIRLKIIHPLRHPELYAAYGKPAGGGILLYGPPGCGKTFLARATAGEVNAAFLSVGINEVLDMWLGQSERNLHALFEQARSHSPCVLFFDEVDALGANRSDLRHGGARQVINQFLAEMDGAKGPNPGLLVLAATNAPWHLDPAFRRPGRFDRIVFVPPPDAPGRAAILRLLCRGKPLGSIDFDLVARKTDGLSGADLKAVVDVAVEQKLREALSDGKIRPLTTNDLTTAASSARPSTQEWFATARNYALYSNQSGLYDEVVKYLQL